MSNSSGLNDTQLDTLLFQAQSGNPPTGYWISEYPNLGDFMITGTTETDIFVVVKQAGKTFWEDVLPLRGNL